MSITIRCSTKFNISFTGVKSHFYKSRMPFVDRTGMTIDNDQAWLLARSKQSNWETLNQLISLRILPENITDPVYDHKTNLWNFEFEVAGYDKHSITDLLNSIKSDADGVPMMTGLGESQETGSTISVSDKNINLWFEVIKH